MKRTVIFSGERDDYKSYDVIVSDQELQALSRLVAQAQYHLRQSKWVVAAEDLTTLYSRIDMLLRHNDRLEIPNKETDDE